VSRCPFCGNNVDSPTKQADGPTATPPLGEASSLRPRPPIGVRKKKPNWVLPATAAAIILAGAGAILLLRRGGESARPAPQPSAVVTPVVTAEPTQSELPFPDPARVDPSDLYPKVKQRALAWNADAHLVSIAATPVVGDKVDLTADGGEIVYHFGTDLSARARPLARLSVTVRRGGIEQAPVSEPVRATAPNARTPAPTSIQVGEPNCVFDAAAKAARASGIVAATPMKLRYEADNKLKRGVWTAKVPGRADLDRVIDGQTCAIIVRR
jgi:hypothetical protein